MSETNHVPEIATDCDTEVLLSQLLNSSESNLDPIAPERALDLYLEDKARECQKSTVNSHRSRLGFFVDWCREQDIENLNELSARDLHEYRVWRRQDLNVVSEKTQMDTLRVFIEWCETIDAVKYGLSLKVKSPSIPDGENARETILHAEQAKEILGHLAKYEYASTEHLLWTLLTETGMRLGAAHALDVEDYRPTTDSSHLQIVHRPETDTPIKNGTNGERRIAISPAVCEVISDHLQHQRPDAIAEYDRQPLLASSQGRLSKSTIRKYVYKWSRPCLISGDCPHDRDPNECKAANSVDKASKCPSSVTPHPIRRGYITHALRSDVPVQVVSERCNVSPPIIDQHYDVRSEKDKMKQREQILREVYDGKSPYA